MVTLIILNIILIILVTFLILYIFKNKKDIKKNVPKNNSVHYGIKNIKYKQIDKVSDRTFDGRFVTDEEYQQMIGSRKSDISILMGEVESEYEHLKELCK
jgi:hypothetical protein